MTDQDFSGSTLKTTLISMVIGLALLIAAFCTLSWNEKRSITTSTAAPATVNFEGKPQAIEATPINPANQSKLIYITGHVNTGAELTDPGFGITKVAIKLTRLVNMYQWQQVEESQSQSRLVGSDQKVTTVNFKKVWSDKVIDSSKFSFQNGSSLYENPKSIAVPARVVLAQQVKLGDFQLSEALIKAMPNAKPISAQDADINAIRKRFKSPVDINHAGPDIYIGADPSNPTIGDIRVSFTAVTPQTVSIIAMQDNNQLVPFQSGGKSIFFIRSGVVPIDQMIPKAKATQTATNASADANWFYRLMGLALMCLGLLAIFRGLASYQHKVAKFKDLNGHKGIKLAVVLGSVLSVLTVAYSGFALHPLRSIALLLIVILVAAFVIKQKSSKA